MVYRSAFRIEERHDEGVEGGGFGAPEMGGTHGNFEGSGAAPRAVLPGFHWRSSLEGGGRGIGPKGMAVWIEERETDAPSAHIGAGSDEGGCGQSGILAVGLEYGVDAVVADMDGRFGVKEDRALEPAHLPVVLIFEVGSVAVAGNLCRDRIEAGLEKGSDFEFSRQAGILAITNVVAVDPGLDGGVGGFEDEKNAASFPLGGKRKSAAIETGGIIGGGMRRVRFEWISDVGIDRFVGSLMELPVGGDGDRAPGNIGEVWIGGFRRDREGGGKPLEFPKAIQFQDEGGIEPSAGSGRFGVGPSAEGRVHGFAISFEDEGVIPIVSHGGHPWFCGCG